MFDRDHRYVKLEVLTLKVSLYLILKGKAIKAYSDEPLSKSLLNRLKIDPNRIQKETLSLDEKALENLNSLKNSKLEFIYEILRLYAIKNKYSL